jgi:hypothetical protein
MSYAHEQIDTEIAKNTLMDFLTSAVQDETATVAGGNGQDLLTELLAGGTMGRNPNILERIYRGKSIEALKYSPARMNEIFSRGKTLPGGINIGTSIRPQFGGGLTAAVTLAPLIKELIHRGMGLDASGLEDEAPWFPEGSSYETNVLPIPPRIEPIRLK